MTAAQYSPREELLNTVTHGLGLPAGVAGLVLLVVHASLYGNAWHVVSSAVFGASLVALYTTSTLYHGTGTGKAKQWLRKFDHGAIFLLIAGTYTPFLLVTLRGPWGWSLFGVVWGLAVAGIILKFWFTGRFRFLSTGIYLGMGWIVIVAIRPLLAALPAGGFGLLIAGGLCYTGGTVFYLWKRLPYHHAVWHLCVLAGSACHWASVFFYIVPGRA